MGIKTHFVCMVQIRRIGVKLNGNNGKVYHQLCLRNKSKRVGKRDATHLIQSGVGRKWKTKHM